ncbi:MAG TPA: hypothetical protein VH678_06030 [Xanthobacteraceae bacterium]
MTMHRFAGMAACLILAGGATLGPARADPSYAGAVQPKPRLELSAAQRQQVVQAVDAKATDDKLPPDFQPSTDAQVPSQKKLPLHPLPRPLVYQIPALKQYYYAKLPKNVLIVDPMTRKVVDVIAR